MNLASVMDDLGTALRTVPNLRVYPFYVTSVSPPAAVIAWPNPYTYDATFGRGSDTVTFPISILVGKVDQRTSRDALSLYVNGSGASSVKQRLEAYTYTTCDAVTVRSVEFSVIHISGIDYLAGTFSVDVTGRGA